MKFILGIQFWFSIWKSINIINNINKLKKYMIIPVDTEKAFENFSILTINKNL